MSTSKKKSLEKNEKKDETDVTKKLRMIKSYRISTGSNHQSNKDNHFPKTANTIYTVLNKKHKELYFLYVILVCRN